MITDKVREELKNAMRAKDQTKLSVMRGILAGFTNELVALGRTPQDLLSGTEAITVITKLAKQRKDSIDQYIKGGRPELADQEKLELAILDEYLPTLMSKEEILVIAQNKKSELGISLASDKGKLMSALMQELRGKADGMDVKNVVDSLF